MPMELKLAKKLFVNDKLTASWTSNKNTFQCKHCIKREKHQKVNFEKLLALKVI